MADNGPSQQDSVSSTRLYLGNLPRDGELFTPFWKQKVWMDLFEFHVLLCYSRFSLWIPLREFAETDWELDWSSGRINYSDVSLKHFVPLCGKPYRWPLTCYFSSDEGRYPGTLQEPWCWEYYRGQAYEWLWLHRVRRCDGRSRCCARLDSHECSSKQTDNAYSFP